MAPLTPLDRFVARVLRYDVDAQDERIARSEAIRSFNIRTRLAAERLVREYDRVEALRVRR